MAIINRVSRDRSSSKLQRNYSHNARYDPKTHSFESESFTYQITPNTAQVAKQTKVSNGEIVKNDTNDAHSVMPFDLQSNLKKDVAKNKIGLRLRTVEHKRDNSASEDDEDIVQSRYNIPTRLTYNFRNTLPQSNTRKIP